MIVEIGVVGFSGRMGQAITEVILDHPSAAFAGGVTHTTPTRAQLDKFADTPHILTENPDILFPKCDVVIDFTHASATTNFVKKAAQFGKAFVSGTTGLSDETMQALKDASKEIPVLHATNTSLSLVVVRRLLKVAAQALKDEPYDISILDKHHRWKKDAPSGTALTLGQAIMDGNGGTHEPTYAAIRGGSIVGEHDVLFAGNGEYITIHHQITDRRVFARGAVHAAVWLANQKPGWYSIDDIIQV